MGHICYMGPPGQVKPNYFFDNFGVSQKDSADEAILSRHSQEGEGKKKNNKGKKSQIALSSTLDRRQRDVNISILRQD